MLALSLLLALSASAPQATSAAPLAHVDGVSITRADVEERLRAMAAARQRQEPSGAVGDLVEEALLAAEARRLGLDREPATRRAIERERRRLAVDALLARLAPEPTDAQLRELFHLTADTAQLVILKVATEPEARAALERVKAGGDLGAEARRSPDRALAARGGDTGLVARAVLDPAIAKAAFGAEPGSLVGPIELQLGWAIARVVSRQVADESGFPARRDSIAAFAREQQRGHVRSMTVRQLKQKAGVTLDEAFLRTAAQAAPPTEEELEHVVANVNGEPVRFRDIHAALSRLTGPQGHGAGAVRISFAWTEVERILLEQEALSKGLDQAPSVTVILPGIERYVLASSAAERIAARAGADRSDGKVRKRLDELRASAKVTVDDAAVRRLGGRG